MKQKRVCWFVPESYHPSSKGTLGKPNSINIAWAHTWDLLMPRKAPVPCWAQTAFMTPGQSCTSAWMKPSESQTKKQNTKLKGQQGWMIVCLGDLWISPWETSVLKDQPPHTSYHLWRTSLWLWSSWWSWKKVTLLQVFSKHCFHWGWKTQPRCRVTCKSWCEPVQLCWFDVVWQPQPSSRCVPRLSRERRV